MQLGGLAEETSPEEVCALAAIDHRGKEEAVERAKEFFMTYACMVPTGLPELPEPWLLGLTNILWGLRQPHWHRLQNASVAANFKPYSSEKMRALEKRCSGKNEYEPYRHWAYLDGHPHHTRMA